MKILSCAAILLSISQSSAVASDWYCPSGKLVYKPYSCLRNFYINSTVGKDTNPGSLTAPWATIQRAGNGGTLMAGDCVNVAAGTYNQSGSGYNGLAIANGGNGNSSTGYVTFISAPNHSSKITGNAALTNLINILAPYIIIDGFDIDATSVTNSAVMDASSQAHHLVILNNLIHDAGGAGVGFARTDYLTVYGNAIYNNSFTNPIRASGISVYEPLKIEGFIPTSADSSPIHISIKNNVVWSNSTKNNCLGQPNCQQSDGHGIIADDWLHTQDGTNIAYPFQGLIQSNLAFNNGGAGIAVFISRNVIVSNNTAYNNNLDIHISDPSRGEIFVVGSNNSTFSNNITYAFPVSSDPILRYNTAILESTAFAPNYSNIVWKNNITFNGTVGDPSANFQTPTAAADLAQFRATNKAGVWPILNPYAPVAGSPALGAGISTPSFSPKSLCGVSMTSPPNIGAY